MDFMRQSFVFLPGVGMRLEQNIRRAGTPDWDSFLAAKKVRGISPRRKTFYDRLISEARQHLREADLAYFKDILPAGETWRLYETFRDDCCFIDIETSGIGEGYITVIGLFDGISTKTMVRNIDYRLLRQELVRHKLIVSYNGSRYDLPHLTRFCPELFEGLPHIDLRDVCDRIGLKGGLKLIEKKLGIRRKNQVIEKLYGGDPLALYRMYHGSGDDYYLDLLVEYNEEDVINLRQIADYAIPRLKALTLSGPAPDHAHAANELSPSPAFFTADALRN